MKNDDEIVIGVTATLKNYLQLHPGQFEMIKSVIEHYVAEYRRAAADLGADKKSLAHSFHTAIDKLIDESVSAVASELSCRRGCAHCCYVNVDISEDEADLILYAMREKGIQLDEQKLKHQAKVERWNQLSYKDRRCPLLGTNNECMIYEHRPMSCRKYHVRSPAEQCNSQKYQSGDVAVLSINYAEAMASAIFSLIDSDRLSRMLLKKMK